MGEKLDVAYKAALEELESLAEVARGTGSSYRTIQSRWLGDRRVTEAAAQDLVRYLRSRSRVFAAAAEKLEAAAEVDREEESRG